jgi:hypothetical protein
MALMLAAVGTSQGIAQAPAASNFSASGVVADVRRLLSENYVVADIRPKLDAVLAKGLAEGRYNLSDPAALADRINADLSGVAEDKHLGMHYAPDEYAALKARPGDAGADDAPASPEDVAEANRVNHGITAMKLLPGNIRYIETRGFIWTGAKNTQDIDAAMAFLKQGDAAIIDIRRNGGGSPDAVQYMISHFLEPNRKLITFHMGARGVDVRSTLASLPAGRMVGKPLYVLTSGMSASAAEEFAGHVAGFEIGEVIGAPTAGAAFRNRFFPVSGGFVISVSVGRPLLASTGKDWEGAGIRPTTAVDPDKALEVAQLHALRKLAMGASPKDKSALEAQAIMLAAQLDPVATALPLPAYAGRFGERSITLKEGALAYQRGDGPSARLIAVGPNAFVLDRDPTVRIEFKVAGSETSGLDLIRGDGSRVSEARTR